MTYLPDTNILIDVINGKQGVKRLLSQLVLEGHELASCAVTVAEVHSGIQPADTAKIQDFLSALHWYSITRAVAVRAGELRYAWARQGVTLALSDALIAAAALEYGTILVTSNRKHFPMPELRVYDGQAP